jgi:hypothetical protein
MFDTPKTGSVGLAEERNSPSLIERVFDKPKYIGQAEYTTLYDFLIDLDSDMRDDPASVITVLEEFSNWAQYMIERVRKAH